MVKKSRREELDSFGTSNQDLNGTFSIFITCLIIAKKARDVNLFTGGCTEQCHNPLCNNPHIHGYTLLGQAAVLYRQVLQTLLLA